MGIKIDLSFSDGIMIEQVLRDRANDCRGYAEKYPTMARAFKGSAKTYDAMAERFEAACENLEGDES